MMNQSLGTPTIVRYNNFDVRYDCERIQNSLKSSSHIDQVILILARRNSSQRFEIANYYQQMYNKSLIEDIKAKTKGDEEFALVMLLQPTNEQDAFIVQNAVKGLGTDESALSDVLCSRTPHELRQIRETYRQMYRKDMDKDIAEDTSGKYQSVLKNLLKPNREELTPDMMAKVQREGPMSVINEFQAQKDASDIITSGEKKFNDCVPKLIDVLTSRHKYQLQGTLDVYKKSTGKDLYYVVEEKMGKGNDTGKAIQNILLSQTNLSQYNLMQLYEATHNKVNTKALAKIFIQRSEIDLEDLKMDYRQRCECDLMDVVKSKTSGNMRLLLYTLLEGNKNI